MALKCLFWAALVEKLQKTLLRMKLRIKRYTEVMIPTIFWIDWNPHPWILFCTEIHFKQSNLKIWEQFCPKIGILRKEFEKTTVEFRIELSNCHLSNSWILLCTDFRSKESTLKFWDQICPKKYFRRESFKKIPELKINNLQYRFVLSFILNKSFSSFEAKLA